jgi:hypothetical protein
VNEDDGKDTLASTRERVLMVKTALRKFSDRIEVVASTPAKREEDGMLCSRTKILSNWSSLLIKILTRF